MHLAPPLAHADLPRFPSPRPGPHALGTHLHALVPTLYIYIFRDTLYGSKRNSDLLQQQDSRCLAGQTFSSTGIATPQAGDPFSSSTDHRLFDMVEQGALHPPCLQPRRMQLDARRCPLHSRPILLQYCNPLARIVSVQTERV